MFWHRRRLRTSRWRGADGRQKVLVESNDGAIQWATEMFLRNKEGYAVACCNGPDREHGRCPLVLGEACPAAEEADVIVHGLRLGSEDNRSVLVALRAAFPDKPVVVEVPKPEIARYEDDLAGCHVVPFPYRRETLAEAIDATLGRVEPAP